MDKIYGITYFNFEDKETKRVNKGVNVSISSPINEKMGVGFKSEVVKFKIENFNALFDIKLPTADKEELQETHKKELLKFLNRDVTILADTRGIPAVVQFKGV